VRIVVLGSGVGSNCASLLHAQMRGELGEAKIVAIFTDNEKAGILEVAHKHKIKAQYCGPYQTVKIDKEQNQSPSDDRWIKAIKPESPDLIILAGFMKVLSSYFINYFNHKIINLHPSILPSFKGLNAIQKAWDAGVKITGCTVHWVSSELDMGPIIEQSHVRISENDTFKSLTTKIHTVEHSLLPKVVAGLSTGKYSFQTK